MNDEILVKILNKKFKKNLNKIRNESTIQF